MFCSVSQERERERERERESGSEKGNGLKERKRKDSLGFLECFARVGLALVQERAKKREWNINQVKRNEFSARVRQQYYCYYYFCCALLKIFKNKTSLSLLEAIVFPHLVWIL
jgi:hypothetical protein